MPALLPAIGACQRQWCFPSAVEACQIIVGGAEALVQGDLERHIGSGLLRSPGFLFSSNIEKIFISVQMDVNDGSFSCHSGKSSLLPLN